MLINIKIKNIQSIRIINLKIFINSKLNVINYFLIYKYNNFLIIYSLFFLDLL